MTKTVLTRAQNTLVPVPGQPQASLQTSGAAVRDTPTTTSHCRGRCLVQLYPGTRKIPHYPGTLVV
eukprot:3693582-Rhodomonas_salina.1